MPVACRHLIIALQCGVDTTGHTTLIHLITTKQKCQAENQPVKAGLCGYIDMYEHAHTRTLPEHWPVLQTKISMFLSRLWD